MKWTWDVHVGGSVRSRGLRALRVLHIWIERFSIRDVDGWYERVCGNLGLFVVG